MYPAGELAVLRQLLFRDKENPDNRKISLKQLYLSWEKQSDCFLKLYFITLDTFYD